VWRSLLTTLRIGVAGSVAATVIGQLDQLIKLFGVGVDDFWVDSRHEVLTPGSVRCRDTWHGFDALLSARLPQACRPRGRPARRLR